MYRVSSLHQRPAVVSSFITLLRTSSDRHSMIVGFVRKSISFHSHPLSLMASSQYQAGPWVPSFTSNNVPRIFRNRKLDFSSNFSTSNLVVVVVLLAIALIPIVDNLSLIKQQRNTQLKIRQWKCRKSTTRKYHHTIKEQKI